MDSCHIFAAGYDIGSEAGYANTMVQFESSIGLENLLYIHLNDSKNPLGSKVDRHEHIGLGHIGLEAFECFMNDPRLNLLGVLGAFARKHSFYEFVNN